MGEREGQGMALEGVTKAARKIVAGDGLLQNISL
jgi:hypothetical protein